MKALLFCLLLVVLATSRRVHSNSSSLNNIDAKWAKESSPSEEAQDFIDGYTAKLNKVLGTDADQWTITDQWTNELPAGLAVAKHVWVDSGSNEGTVGFIKFKGSDHFSMIGAQKGHVNPGQDKFQLILD